MADGTIITPPDFSRKYLPEPDDPIECVRCGLTPERAMRAKIKPALLVGPGRIQCDCFHPSRPYLVADELEKRQERDGRPIGKWSGWYQVYLEDVHRGEPGGNGSGSSRRREFGKVDESEERPEQDWQGFAYYDRAEVERLEKFAVAVKGTLPRWMRARWALEARVHGRNAESRLLRWYIHQHLRDLVDVPELGREPKGKVPFKLLLTRSHADLWDAKKAALTEALGRKVSSPEILAAVLLEEWK